MRWRITIELWPHSTGNGAEADQKAVGDREHYYYVDAYDISEALKFAHAFSDGACLSPAVWKAPIMGVHRYVP